MDREREVWLRADVADDDVDVFSLEGAVRVFYGDFGDLLGLLVVVFPNLKTRLDRIHVTMK